MRIVMSPLGNETTLRVRGQYRLTAAQTISELRARTTRALTGQDLDSALELRHAESR